MARSPDPTDAAVGVEELFTKKKAPGERAARRLKQRKTRRPRQGFFRTLVQILGELLITAGVVLLLFIAWELWWTNIDANNAQQHAISAFAKEFQGPVAPVNSGAEPKEFGPPVVMADIDSPGKVFGVVYIPRFGATYSRPLVDGVAREQLDTLGLGRYATSTMPGGIGNFAVAGHRQTHGAVLDAIDSLVPGDKIYVQTKDGYYTYVFRNNQIVLPTRADVILPVPTEAGAVPTERFMTMTSCNPRFGAEERIIAYSLLESWQPASAGPPAAIAAQVAANSSKG